MLDGLTPELAPRLFIAIGGVAVAFLVLIAVLLYLRRRNSPLFIKGGRVREHRLLVLDAAAIDAKRRLVLVRRDDTEHLIMIGGPTDLVIETGINVENRAKTRPAPAVAGQSAAAPQQPVMVHRPAATPAAAPVPARPQQAASQPNQVRQTNDRQNRQTQNNENNKNQNPRRLERQAARAAEAAKAAAAAATASSVSNVSAMSSVLYNEGREPLGGAKSAGQTAAANPAVVSPAVVPASERKAATSTEQAENVLDLARARMMNTPHQAVEKQSSNNEAAIRAMEEQLEAGKAEAARLEAARLEAERAAAAKADAERAEAVHAEAARMEARRLEAQKAELARREAERQERQRQEAERAEAERAEAERIQAQKAEAERTEAARVEAERIASARAEAMARFEAARRAQAEQRHAAEQATQGPAREEHPTFRSQWPLSEAQLETERTTPAAKAEWPFAEAADEDIAADQPETVETVSIEPEIAEPATVEPVTLEPQKTERLVETASLEEKADKSQERLASDFEKLLEAELEADGVLDHYVAPAVSGERRDPATGAPLVNPVQRDTQPITGAMPGTSIEQDMARRLGEISLNRKTDT